MGLDDWDVEQELLPAQARKLLSHVLRNGKVVFTRHARDELAADKRSERDALNVMAKYLGVTRQTVSRWENEGGIPVGTERLLKFMASQGAAVDDYPLEERKRETPRYHQNSRG